MQKIPRSGLFCKRWPSWVHLLPAGLHDVGASFWLESGRTRAGQAWQTGIACPKHDNQAGLQSNQVWLWLPRPGAGAGRVGPGKQNGCAGGPAVVLSLR
jgi:hypothetical protein